MIRRNSANLQCVRGVRVRAKELGNNPQSESNFPYELSNFALVRVAGSERLSAMTKWEETRLRNLIRKSQAEKLEKIEIKLFRRLALKKSDEIANQLRESNLNLSEGLKQTARIDFDTKRILA